MLNAHETIYWIRIEGAWTPWTYMYSYNWLLSWQNKHLWGKSSSGLLFPVNIAGGSASYFSLPEPNRLQNLTPKCKILTCFELKLQAKWGLNSLIFFNWLSNGSELVQNVIQWHQNLSFFSKNYKKFPNGRGCRPQTPIASEGWRLLPQTPACGVFELP